MTTAAWTPTHAEYHADRTSVSRSMLEDFLTSPRLYHGRYITGEIPPREETPQMRLGTLVHTAVLEPGRWKSDYVVPPKVDRRTKAGKAQWAEWVEANEGKERVELDEWKLVNAIAYAVREAPHWKWLKSLTPLGVKGLIEQSLRWEHETGFTCRCRIDVLGALVIDLKTVGNASVEPSTFAKSVANFGYHRQAAWYLEGVQEALGRQSRFVFIAVGTKPPHEVAAYELDDEAVLLGQQQIDEGRRRLAACIESGDWRAAHEKQVTRVALPRWAGYRDYELEE